MLLSDEAKQRWVVGAGATVVGGAGVHKMRAPASSKGEGLEGRVQGEEVRARVRCLSTSGAAARWWVG